MARSLEVLKRLAAALTLACCFTVATAQRLPRRVCITEENAPLSLKVKSQPATQNMQGMDVRMAQAIAPKLGRELKLVPFESNYEQETPLAHEVNAMLWSGVCELASGCVLLKSGLGSPTRPTARVCNHPRAPPPAPAPMDTAGHSAGQHGVSPHGVGCGVACARQTGGAVV